MPVCVVMPEEAWADKITSVTRELVLVTCQLAKDESFREHSQREGRATSQ